MVMKPFSWYNHVFFVKSKLKPPQVEGVSMLKTMRGAIFGMLCVAILHVWVLGIDDWSKAMLVKWEQVLDSPSSHVNPLLPQPNLSASDGNHNFIINGNESDLYEQDNLEVAEQGLYIGMTTERLKQILGEPVRKEPSAYGYKWWIYNQDWESYIQVGIEADHVVSYYTNAPGWSFEGYAAGMFYQLSDSWKVKEEISFNYERGQYTFSLTEQDQLEKPLFLKNNLLVQLYVDIHDHHISGIRVMDKKTALLHRPYTLKYTGNLLSPEEWSQWEWKKIEEAYEKQIFDIVNVTRHIHQLTPFEWHEEVAEAAKWHSFDMLTHNYFDHVSPYRGSLSDRLNEQSVGYLSAGENIAWNYIDAADAHEGWMNSPGHRLNVLHGTFNHLGVGVIEKYYTQNFILK